MIINLNPFSSELRVVGEARMGDTWDPVGDVSQFFPLGFQGPPTLILTSNLMEKDDNIHLVTKFLAGFDDGLMLLDRVRRHPGDPWKRVQEEVDGAFENLKEGHTGGRRLSLDEASELADNLSDLANVLAEFRAFTFAWNGAIDFQGSSDLKGEAIGLEDFMEIFIKMAPTCNLPDFNSDK
jgi:hypothetical protein